MSEIAILVRYGEGLWGMAGGLLILPAGNIPDADLSGEMSGPRLEEGHQGPQPEPASGQFMTCLEGDNGMTKAVSCLMSS